MLSAMLRRGNLTLFNQGATTHRAFRERPSRDEATTDARCLPCIHGRFDVIDRSFQFQEIGKSISSALAETAQHDVCELGVNLRIQFTDGSRVRLMDRIV